MRWMVVTVGVIMVVPNHVCEGEQGLEVPVQRHRWKSLGVLFAILLLALAVRYATAWSLRPVPTSDFKIYWDIAMGLAEGRGYVIGGVPSAFRPIGYPLLLSLVIRLVGPDWWHAILVQVLMSTAIVAVTYWFTRRLFGVGAGLAAAALTAVMPDHVLWSTVLNSEIPAILCTLLAVTLWIPPIPAKQTGRSAPETRPKLPIRRTSTLQLAPSWALLASGALLGLASLTRPVMLPVPALYFFYAWLTTRTREGGQPGRPFWRPVAWRPVVAGTFVLTLGMVLVVGPWTVRNYAALGALVPVSTNGGVNLWQGNNPNATGGFYWSDDPAVNPLLRVSDEVEQDRLGRRLALQWIREHPWDFLRLGFIKWGWLLTDVRTAVLFTLQQASRPIPPLLVPLSILILKMGLYSLLAVTLAGIRMWWLAGRPGSSGRYLNRARTSVPVLFLAFMLALHFVFPGWDRFRFPFTPFMLALAGLAVTTWGRQRAAIAGFFRRVRATRRPGPAPVHGEVPGHGRPSGNPIGQ